MELWRSKDDNIFKPKFKKGKSLKSFIIKLCLIRNPFIELGFS